MKVVNAKFFVIVLGLSSSYVFSDEIALLKTTDPVEAIFTHIYETNQWLSKESISGPGSELRFTQKTRQGISALIKRFGITSIADAPCGDCNWMRYVDIGTCRYIGYDIVRELVEGNKRRFVGTAKEFRHINLLETVIEKADLIICRDMLAHLNNEQIFTVLRNFKKSGSKYILMTTGITTTSNSDIVTGDWRRLNLELAPFNFPRPLALIEEDVPFEFERGKHLGLWFLDDLNI
jgi:hypothetical protein